MKIVKESLKEFVELQRWQKIGIVLGVFSLITGIIFWRFPFTERQPQVVIISSPYMNEQTGQILPEVRGTVYGDVQKDYKILVGHREKTEQSIAMHADRHGEILQDKSFTVNNIHLGSETKGINTDFEIIVLIVRKETLDGLHLKEDDNPLTTLPNFLAKAVTSVKRVR